MCTKVDLWVSQKHLDVKYRKHHHVDTNVTAPIWGPIPALDQMRNALSLTTAGIQIHPKISALVTVRDTRLLAVVSLVFKTIQILFL